MRGSGWRAVLTALTIAAALAVAGCGEEDSDSGSDSGGGQAAQQKERPKIKVGLVTDIGGLNDRSFNQSANEGLKRAAGELGVQTRALISKSNRDYVPNLSTLANQRYDVVIAVGFLMAEATNTVAKRFPNVKFAIIDFSQAGLKDKPKNVQGLLFKEQEAGYLVGYLAGLYAKDESAKAIGTVGGQKIPPVDHYIAGFRAGAEEANADVRTLNGYSEDFIDQAKCKEIALDQIAKGSQVVFQVAGQCGLGAIDAAKEKSVQAIGVDDDQAYLGDQVMTSALKKIDVAVFTAIKQAQEGTFKAGTDVVATVKNGGVGVGKYNTVGEKYADQVKQVQDRIASGEITGIPEEVK
jgi:basic membrane protein A and related proteins